MMEAAYGHTVNSLDDEFVEFAQEALTATTEAGSPGSMLVDFFPICELTFEYLYRLNSWYYL